MCCHHEKNSHEIEFFFFESPQSSLYRGYCSNSNDNGNDYSAFSFSQDSIFIHFQTQYIYVPLIM